MKVQNFWAQSGRVLATKNLNGYLLFLVGRSVGHSILRVREAILQKFKQAMHSGINSSDDGESKRVQHLSCGGDECAEFVLSSFFVPHRQAGEAKRTKHGLGLLLSSS